MRYSTQQIAATVLLTALGVVVAGFLLGQKDMGLLMLVLPVSPGIPLAMASLIPYPAGADQRTNLAVMLICGILVAVGLCLHAPQIRHLVDITTDPFLFPLTRWLWRELSWWLLIFFPILMVSGTLDLALMIFGLFLCLLGAVGLPSLGALIGWLIAAAARSMSRSSAPPASQ